MYGPTGNCVYGACDAEEVLFPATADGMGILPLIVPLIGAAAAIGGPMLMANQAEKQAKKDMKAQQQAMQLQAEENARIRAAQGKQIEQLVALGLGVAGLVTAYKIVMSGGSSTKRKRRR